MFTRNGGQKGIWAWVQVAWMKVRGVRPAVISEATVLLPLPLKTCRSCCSAPCAEPPAARCPGVYYPRGCLGAAPPCLGAPLAAKVPRRLAQGSRGTASWHTALLRTCAVQRLLIYMLGCTEQGEPLHPLAIVNDEDGCTQAFRGVTQGVRVTYALGAACGLSGGWGCASQQEREPTMKGCGGAPKHCCCAAPPQPLARRDVPMRAMKPDPAPRHSQSAEWVTSMDVGRLSWPSALPLLPRLVRYSPCSVNTCSKQAAGY